MAKKIRSPDFCCAQQVNIYTSSKCQKVFFMSFVHQIDWGTLTCIPLCVSEDPTGNLGPPHTAWTTSGEATRNARIKILERARSQGVSLTKLADILRVKWVHFEEWAETLDKLPLDIILDHLPWKDEIKDNDNRTLIAQLEVGEIKIPA